MTRKVYGTGYQETLRVQVHANCRIRRVSRVCLTSQRKSFKNENENRIINIFQLVPIPDLLL